MKDSAETKAKTSTGSTISAAELAEQAIRSCEEAIRLSMKLQAETLECWSQLLKQSAAFSDWQKCYTRLSSAITSTLPALERQFTELMTLTQENTRRSAELLRKTMEASQAANLSESQQKWMEVWTSSLGAIRANTEAVTQANGRALDSWLAFTRQAGEFAQFRAPRA